MNASRTVSKKSAPVVPYPNAADRRYFLDRLLDKILCVASFVGVVVILFFLFTMP